MSSGEFLTRSSIWIALICYFVVASGQFACRASKHSCAGWLRLVWTIGCIAYLGHVFCAFHVYHNWSHAEAYRYTAQETNGMIGLDWGGGLYLNYLFTLLWITDAVWWWRDRERYRHRSRLVSGFLHGFLFFMVFNATVVFGVGLIRWFGLGGCLSVAFFACIHRPRPQ